MKTACNYLDTNANLLYCSRRCALRAGAKIRHLTRVTPQQYWDSFVDTGLGHNVPYKSPWGLLCRECANDYHGGITKIYDAAS